MGDFDSLTQLPSVWPWASYLNILCLRILFLFSALSRERLMTLVGVGHLLPVEVYCLGLLLESWDTFHQCISSLGSQTQNEIIQHPVSVGSAVIIILNVLILHSWQHCITHYSISDWKNQTLSCKNHKKK